MNGLSFYSECLDVSFGALLFTDLAHRLYIPMSNDTLCVKPVNFTSLFSTIEFGLIVHSSLATDRLRLNSFIQLLPGYDGTAVSLGFYKHSNNRVGLIHSLNITMFDRTFGTQGRLSGNELTFSIMTNLFNQEFYAAHLQGLASTSRQWRDMILNVEGWFPKNDRSFVNTMEMSAREEITRLGEASNTRKEQADQRLNDAITGLEEAEKQLEQAREALTNSSLKLNRTKVNLDRARDRLSEAKANVTNATRAIREAEEAIDNVCQPRQCELECQNATRRRTVYEDTYYTAEGTCDSVCNVTMRERVPPFTKPIYRWQYVQCCWNNSENCGGQLCTTRVCSFVCKAVPATRPVFHYRLQVVEVPCIVSCLVRQYNTTIERTEEYIDPCGRRVPNATCVAMNADCNRNREISLRVLEMKRSDLVGPLRERNRAREKVSLLEVRVSQAESDRAVALENLESSQIFYTSSVTYKDAVNTSRSMILEDIRNGQHLYNLSQRYGNNVFIITNVTFSVPISEINNPSTFPITITYTTQDQSRQLNYVYHFSAPFLSQKDNLVDVLIDDILTQSRRKRRQTGEEMNLSGREQFEIRCTQLKSIDSFIQYILTSLEESETRGRMIRENFLELIESVDITLNTTSVSNEAANFTRLKELYGITDEDIKQSRRGIGDGEDEVLDSVKSSYRSLQSEAQAVLDSLNTTLLTQWRSSIELLLQSNGTVAGRSCLGLVDCILVLNSSLDSLLSFAPSSISSVLSQRQRVASQLFLQLAGNGLTSFTEAEGKLAPIHSIVKRMMRNGYWCSTPPQITTHPVAETSVQISTQLVLTCTGNSSLPITYQWRKDGVALPDTNSETLTLDNIQVFDEGNYSCEVTNDVSSERSTNSSVHVHVLPEFFQLPSSVITYIGDSNGAYFTCNATSRPDPGWRWYHRSSSRGQWREILGEETNELLKRNPSQADEGEYRCVAYNDFGELSSEPVSLRLVSVTARVLVYSIDISMMRLNNTDYNVTNVSIAKSLRDQFKKAVLFGNVSLSSEASVREITSEEITVSFKLISHNVTSSRTTPLETVVNGLIASRLELDRVRDGVEQFIERVESFEVEYKDSEYQYQPNTFSVDIPEIHCPPGQELHSNRFLCCK